MIKKILSSKTLRVSIDVAIVVAAIILCTLGVKRFFFTDVPSAPVTGAKILLEGVDWSSKKETILLVLDKDCRFCTDSATFYQRIVKLVDANHDLQVIAVTPDSTAEAKTYLTSLGLSIANIKQSALRDLNVPGTPTVLAVDTNGRITESWVGRLTGEQEINVLRRIDALNGK